MSPTLMPTPAPAPLTAADRCDRCGAQAKVRAIMPGGGDLLFCGHHGKKYAEQLSRAAVQILDESDRVPQNTREF